MNKTLANRPKAVDSSTGYLQPNPHDPDAMSEWIQSVEDWFVDFKKELQEHKKKCRSPFCDGEEHRFTVSGVKRTVKCPYVFVRIDEILGEET